MIKKAVIKEVGIAIGLLATIGVTGIAFRYRREIYGAISGKRIISKKASNKAKEELDKWQNGAIKEGAETTVKELDGYWQSVGTTYKKMGDAAWSAAFISWLMKESGAKDTFKYSPSHSVYIVDAINNKKENKGSWKGYKPSEVSIKKGDLICYARQSGVTYDTTNRYDSHCDIVYNVDRKQRRASTIGGNVSNSVKETVVNIDEKGMITSDNKNKYFVVLKNK